MKKALVTFLFLTLLSVKGQNTVSLPENVAPAKAELSDISWMEGHWEGEAFGGTTEELWGPPLGGSMLFSFKLVVDGEIAFYEIGHIRQLEETLVFELKHIHGDLKGWEEKDEVQRFKLVKTAGDRVYFEGFTFEKVNGDEINIYGLIENDDGTTEEMVFNYKRVRR